VTGRTDAALDRLSSNAALARPLEPAGCADVTSTGACQGPRAVWREKDGVASALCAEEQRCGWDVLQRLRRRLQA
jgi:hypothetical protein